MLSSDLIAPEPGYWRRVRSELNAVVLVIAVALALLISTQVLFRPYLFEMWDLLDIVIAWTRYFVEVLSILATMVVAVSMAEHSAIESRVIRVALVVAALLLLPQLLVLVFYWGYTGTWAPASPLAIVGEGLKYSLLGAFMLGVRAVHRRALRAGDEARAEQAARAELERQIDDAQLQLLQAQIEPHFLFNTLANVRRLYRKRPAAGAEAIDNLLVYLRAALPQLRRTTSTLDEEFELVQAYLQLFKVRMGQRLHFTLDLPPSLRAVPFAPVVLVTLAENAIKHGLAPADLG
ncbi:MAG: sensor histidine kinase, partial [Burkholderiaceae bacterium]